MKRKKKRMKQSSQDNLFTQSIDQIKNARREIYFAIYILFLAVLIGSFFPYFFQDKIFAIFEEMAHFLEGKGPLELIFFIFLNNTQASFMSLVSGIFLGVFPILVLVVNGYVIGFAMNLVVGEAGLLVLWRLFPHGVFEIPAILISVGLGMHLGGTFLEERFKIKQFRIQMIFMVLISLLVGILFLCYTTVALQLTSLESPQAIIDSGLAPVATFVFLMNILVFAGMFYTVYYFFKDQSLRGAFISCFKAFIVVVIPLLIIAGCIEGILVYFLA